MIAAPVIAATAVILFRDGPEGREVFLVRRGSDRRFAAGFHAFPGGRLDPEDAEIEVPGLGGEEAALAACAARELFEETGVLVVRGPAPSRAERNRGRRAVLEGTLSFRGFLARHALVLDPARLVPAGRWITPEHLPLRYDARLFLVRLAPQDAPEVWVGELAAGALVPVRDALRRWSRGELLLHPPNLHALRVLARPGPPSPEALCTPPYCEAFVSQRIEFQEGFFLAALRTPTLPPATHTNAWLLPADGGLAVVDPGASDPQEQAGLLALLEAHASEGRPPRAVWLTHVHPDHTGAAALVSQRFGVPVLAHRLAEGRVPGVATVRPARDGDLLGGRFRVLETPGHAREHLSFLDEDSGALVCGDMISTLSTIVIDPPEGDMAEYERQLERLRALGPRTLYPAHGPPVPGAPERLGAYLAHRHAREALVVAALGSASKTLAEVTARAYADTPPAALPLAERSCLATLMSLAAQGRVARSGEGWRR